MTRRAELFDYDIKIDQAALQRIEKKPMGDGPLSLRLLMPHTDVWRADWINAEQHLRYRLLRTSDGGSHLIRFADRSVRQIDFSSALARATRANLRWIEARDGEFGPVRRGCGLLHLKSGNTAFVRIQRDPG